MNDLSSDSKDDNLSEEVDITGSSSTDSSDSIDQTEDEEEHAARTPDHLSDVSDIPTPRKLFTPTSLA